MNELHLPPVENNALQFIQYIEHTE